MKQSWSYNIHSKSFETAKNILKTYIFKFYTNGWFFTDLFFFIRSLKQLERFNAALSEIQYDDSSYISII